MDGHTRGVCLLHHPCSLHWGYSKEKSEIQTGCLVLTVLSMPLTCGRIQQVHGRCGFVRPIDPVLHSTAQNSEVVQETLSSLPGYCCNKCLPSPQRSHANHSQGQYKAFMAELMHFGLISFTD